MNPSIVRSRGFRLPARPRYSSFRPSRGRTSNTTANIEHSRRSQRHLGDIDRARAEPGLAVGEIVFPHPPETLVEALTFQPRPGLVEAAVPLGQRAGVRMAEKVRALK